LNVIENPLTTIDALNDVDIGKLLGCNLACIAEFVVQNFQVHNDENMNCDDERMPTWNDEHTDVHHIILNDEFQPIFAFKWKITRQYERGKMNFR
jgi:hypothetical protein